MARRLSIIEVAAIAIIVLSFSAWLYSPSSGFPFGQSHEGWGSPRLAPLLLALAAHRRARSPGPCDVADDARQGWGMHSCGIRAQRAPGSTAPPGIQNSIVIGCPDRLQVHFAC